MCRCEDFPPYETVAPTPETCTWPRFDAYDSPVCGHTATAAYVLETAGPALRYPTCRVHDTPVRQREARRDGVRRVDLTPAKPHVTDTPAFNGHPA